MGAEASDRSSRAPVALRVVSLPIGVEEIGDGEAETLSVPLSHDDHRILRVVHLDQAVDVTEALEAAEPKGPGLEVGQESREGRQGIARARRGRDGTTGSFVRRTPAVAHRTC